MIRIWLVSGFTLLALGTSINLLCGEQEIDLAPYLGLLDSLDSFAVIQRIAEQEPRAAARTYGALVTHMYWKEKDLAQAIIVGRAGIQHALMMAEGLDRTDPDTANELRGVAKAISYDVGSFTWPGWDEPGIRITATDLELGMDAAKTNLRLARDLDRGDLAVSRGYWLLGAHYVASGAFAEASEMFAQAADRAEVAGQRGEHLLSLGYLALTQMLEHPDSARFEEEYEGLKQHLSTVDDGEFFREQLDTALRVFTSFHDQRD